MRRKRNESLEGLGLIEALVASSLVVLAALQSISTFMASEKVISNAGQEIEAAGYSQATLEKLTARGFDGMTVGPGQKDPLPEGELKNTFKGDRTYAVEVIKDSETNEEAYKKITVVTSWTAGSKSNSKVLVTMISKPDAYKDTSGLSGSEGLGAGFPPPASPFDLASANGPEGFANSGVPELIIDEPIDEPPGPPDESPRPGDYCKRFPNSARCKPEPPTPPVNPPTPPTPPTPPEGGLSSGEEEIYSVMSMCFTAGTEVLTKTGLKNIEQIKKDELVLTRNEATGKNEYKKVAVPFGSTRNKMVDLELASGELIQLSNNHPVYVVSKGWIEAAKLIPGDKLVKDSGNTEPVKKITAWPLDKYVQVYNCEVEGNHNFFVGKEGIMVHNGMKPAPETLEAQAIIQEKILDGIIARLVQYGDPSQGETWLAAAEAGELPFETQDGINQFLKDIGLTEQEAAFFNAGTLLDIYYEPPETEVEGFGTTTGVTTLTEDGEVSTTAKPAETPTTTTTGGSGGRGANRLAY
jgi:hypothetical protein